MITIEEMITIIPTTFWISTSSFRKTKPSTDAMTIAISLKGRKGINTTEEKIATTSTEETEWSIIKKNSSNPSTEQYKTGRQHKRLENAPNCYNIAHLRQREGEEHNEMSSRGSDSNHHHVRLVISPRNRYTNIFNLKRDLWYCLWWKKNKDWKWQRTKFFATFPHNNWSAKDIGGEVGQPEEG
jgi:hypothetical protein